MRLGFSLLLAFVHICWDLDVVTVGLQKEMSNRGGMNAFYCCLAFTVSKAFYLLQHSTQFDLWYRYIVGS